MTILNALKKLHKKMTGQDTNSKTIGGVLDSMQENYAAQPGGGDTYETVAEIEVGEMEQQDDLYGYEISNEERPALQEGENSLFFNDSKYSLQWNDDAGAYVYNINDEGLAIDSPAYGVAVKDSHIMGIVSDTNAIENTTVKILKKVSGGGSVTVDSELSDTSENPVQNKVITAALANAGGDIVINAAISENTITIDPDVDLSKIYTEYKAGKTVKLFVPIAEYGYVSDYILIGARYTAEDDFAFDFAMTVLVGENIYAVSALHFLSSRTTTGTVYNASDKQPLNVEIASVSGTAITLATPAKAINDAYLAHRPVFCDIGAFNARAYLTLCDYTNDSDFVIRFSCVTPEDSGDIKCYWVTFSGSLTGEPHADTIYTPNP